MSLVVSVSVGLGLLVVVQCLWFDFVSGSGFEDHGATRLLSVKPSARGTN